MESLDAESPEETRNIGIPDATKGWVATLALKETLHLVYRGL
jgi:hypothetical protein